MAAENHGIRARIKYRFDNFMSRGGFSVFAALMLLFIGAFIIMSIVRTIANLVIPEKKFAELTGQLWQVFLQVMDSGSIAEDSDLNFIHKIVGVATVFIGLILFSSLVAFITSQFEAKIEDLKKGRSFVIEKGHTLILGFGDRVLEIIRELIVANESEKNRAVVVLAGREKDEMDDFFRDHVAERKTTRIITRSGSTSGVQLLRRVSVDTARSVVILNDANIAAGRGEKDLADARVLKTIMAVIACVGADNIPPIVAELHNANMRKLAQNISPNVAIIDEHSMLAKLMVQTSRTSGLAQVYDTLVGFQGCEFYFYRPEDGLAGKTYGDLLFHFAASTVVGIRTADGNVAINPPAGTPVGENDEAILIAEDDSTIHYLPKKLEFTAPDSKPAPPRKKGIENQLISGWGHKTGIIVEEYSNYLSEGSSIDVIVSDFDDAMKKKFSEIQRRHGGIKMRLIKTDIHNPGNLEKLRPERFDNVIIVAGDGGDPELRDSVTIAGLLEFRSYFKNLGRKDIRTQLITEVADSENIEVIQETGVKDFLISNQFVSKIYAQVSEEPAMLKIYDDLFNPDGSEVYLKPLGMFLSPVPGTISFGKLCAAALRRNETAIGVRLLGEEMDRSNHYGIYINPDKNREFSVTAEDMLITLAEDES